MGNTTQLASLRARKLFSHCWVWHVAVNFKVAPCYRKIINSQRLKVILSRVENYFPAVAHLFSEFPLRILNGKFGLLLSTKWRTHLLRNSILSERAAHLLKYSAHQHT
jgi:hypothetical protein